MSYKYKGVSFVDNPVITLFANRKSFRDNSMHSKQNCTESAKAGFTARHRESYNNFRTTVMPTGEYKEEYSYGMGSDLLLKKAPSTNEVRFQGELSIWNSESGRVQDGRTLDLTEMNRLLRDFGELLLHQMLCHIHFIEVSRIQNLACEEHGVDSGEYHPCYGDNKNVFDMEWYMKKQRTVVKPTDNFEV